MWKRSISHDTLMKRKNRVKIPGIMALILILFTFPQICRGDTETLRPNAAGDEHSISSPEWTEENPHWELVDEVSADESTTFIYTDSHSYQRDLYNLPAHSVGSGIINFIKIYFRMYCGGGSGIAQGKPSQKSGTTVTDGTEFDRYGGIWETFSESYTTNPATGLAYTWDEIDALQIGVAGKASTNGYSGDVRVTQVYVEVDYTPPVVPTVTNSTGASSVTTNSARLNGNVTDTGGEDPTVTVYWGGTDGGTTPGSWANNVGLGDLSAGAFYTDISSLDPNTTYYYRCYATNSGGNDWADDTEEFNTSVATPTVTTNAADNIGSTDATLHGNITDIGGENCDQRGFEWDIDSGESYANTWTESGTYGIEAFNHIISSLSPGVTYYFRAKAHNSAGWAYGSELSFSTISTITITGTDLAPAGVSPGDTEVGMLQLGLITDGGSATLTHAKVDLTGTAADGVVDISSVEVWKDDGNHTWDGSGSKADTEIGSGTFSPRTVTIDITDQTITTDSWDFFIVYDIAVGADPSHTAGAKLLSDTYIIVAGSDEVSSSGFPIESGTSTLPVELSTFTGQYLNNVPTLYWTTESETDNLCWNIYRNSIEDFSSSIKVSDLIEGYGTTSEPHSYIYEDLIEDAIAGDTYWYWLESIDYSGCVYHYNRIINITIPDGSENPNQLEPPISYNLQGSPNPSKGSTKISFTLSKTALIEIKIYNIRGELVKDLYNGTAYGDVEVKRNWDGRDENGIEQPTGIYLYGLKVNGKVNDINRLILIR